MTMEHEYRAICHWEGSTAGGHDAYDRTHTVELPPAAAALSVSADPHFLGDGKLVNPESLFLAAAASCQLLSFLAVAARARLVITAYDDDARAVLSGRPLAVTGITLRPRITAEPPATVERVRHLVEVAHRECYIANSVSTNIEVEPEITVERAGRD